jgi:hypothetical protein
MPVIAKWKITTLDKEGNTKTFETGDTVEGIGAAEENRLVKQGAVEKVKKVEKG